MNEQRVSPAPGQVPALSLLDLAVGAVATTAAATAPVVSRAVTVASPVVGAVLRPPVLAHRHQPATWLTSLTRRGAERRNELRRVLSAVLDTAIPLVMEALLRRVDLTGAVRRFVDLDEVVADVDLDAVAARLDVDAIVARLDLTRIVRDRVDLDALVATVDLDAAAARLDVAAVIDRIDLVGLAEDVIAEVDLPEIIRGSSGAMASDTVRGVRMQGISADQAVGRAVDRLRHRRGRSEAASGVQPP